MGYVVKGVPARAVASVAEEPRNMSVVVVNNGRVKTIDDLKGKRIGVTTAGSLTDWLARRLAMDKGGVTTASTSFRSARCARGSPR